VKCTFCGRNIRPNTGKMVVSKVGKISYFCSGKCEKNTNLKRDSKKVRWTESFRLRRKRDFYLKPFKL